MRLRWRMCVVLSLACLALASCASPEPGEQLAVDEDQIRNYLEADGFTVPRGFEFAEAFVFWEFVGAPAWSARYEADAAFGDASTVAAANPNFPPMEPVGCGTVPPGKWSSVGFECRSGALSTRYPASGGMDSMTIVLTQDDESAQLYMYSAGH